MGDGMNQYRRELGKALLCTRGTKKRLMAQLLAHRQKLDGESPAPTYDQLVTLYGPPGDMAAMLMEEVPPEEQRRCRKRRRLYRGIAVGLLAALIVFTVYMTFIKEFKTTTIEFREYIYIEGAAPDTSEHYTFNQQNLPDTEHGG